MGLTVGLADGCNGGGGGLDLDFFRVTQMLVRDTADRVGHGGREQGRLAAFRRVFENPFHIVDKAHAQHFVGFVEHQRGQVLQRQAFAFEVIHDPAGGADDDMRTARELAQLHHHALAAIHRQHMKAGQMMGVFLQGFGHLNGQFARRCQHQGLRFGDG